MTPVKIYTKTGDGGDTALFGGGRVPKDNRRVEAYGAVDELNSFVGLSLMSLADADVRRGLLLIQNDLFSLGANLATPGGDDSRPRPQTPDVPVARLEAMEQWIDEATKELPELREFVLPGGSEASATLHVCRSVCRRAIRIDDQVHFPHSLGVFYQALTQYLGFPHYGDEYKVMGLAPYGAPSLLPALRELVRVQPDGSYRLGLEYFRHDTEHVDYVWRGGAPTVGRLFSDALVDLLGPAREPGTPLEQRHRDVARSVQAMYEEAFFALLSARHAAYGLPDLALAGGCAMNSVANGKITRRTPFERV